MSESITEYLGAYFKDKTSLLTVLDGTIWNYTMQVLDYTRSYEYGLEILTKLLGEVEKEKDSLEIKIYERCLHLIYWKLLDFLDKLDRWEEYIEAWERIYKNVKINGKTFQVAPWRKRCIEGKLEKKRAGKYPGKLHEQQSELTPEEVQERYEWMMKYRTTGIYDFNPPASRQRKKRLEEKRNTIEIKPSKIKKKNNW